MAGNDDGAEFTDATDTPDVSSLMERAPGRRHPGRDAFMAAAIEAELETGRREETEAEARRNVFERLARIVGGFFLVGVGIALLPLPGPGWLVIMVGLSILPFAWTERMIHLIRRKVPGIPEDGRIPTSTWVILGAVVVTSTLVGLFFGDNIVGWVSDTWQSVQN